MFSLNVSSAVRKSPDSLQTVPVIAWVGRGGGGGRGGERGAGRGERGAGRGERGSWQLNTSR